MPTLFLRNVGAPERIYWSSAYFSSFFEFPEKCNIWLMHLENQARRFFCSSDLVSSRRARIDGGMWLKKLLLIPLNIDFKMKNFLNKIDSYFHISLSFFNIKWHHFFIFIFFKHLPTFYGVGADGWILISAWFVPLVMGVPLAPDHFNGGFYAFFCFWWTIFLF